MTNLRLVFCCRMSAGGSLCGHLGLLCGADAADPGLSPSGWAGRWVAGAEKELRGEACQSLQFPCSIIRGSNAIAMYKHTQIATQPQGNEFAALGQRHGKGRGRGVN